MHFKAVTLNLFLILFSADFHLTRGNESHYGTKQVVTKRGQKIVSVVFGCPPLTSQTAFIICTHFLGRFLRGINCRQKVPLGTKAFFFCPEGAFTSDEVKKATCVYPGRWTSRVITCTLTEVTESKGEEITTSTGTSTVGQTEATSVTVEVNQPSIKLVCPPLVFTTMYVTCTFEDDSTQCDKPLHVNTIATMECKPGFEWKDKSEDAEIRCLTTESWSNKPLTCVDNSSAFKEIGYMRVPGYGFIKPYLAITVREIAMKACTAHGANLLNIDTDPKKVATLAVLNQTLSLLEFDVLSNFWMAPLGISGTSLFVIKNGSNFNYGWCKSEPSRAAGKTCVAFYPMTACFIDSVCTVQRRHICEIDFK